MRMLGIKGRGQGFLFIMESRNVVNGEMASIGMFPNKTRRLASIFVAHHLRT